MDLEVGVVRIRLAGKQALQLQPAQLLAHLADGLLGLGDNLLVTLLLAHLDELDVLLQALLEIADAADLLVQQLPLAHQLLRPLRIIPQRGVFRLPVQLFQPGQRVVPVKDTSSAVPGTA